jgi:hypothetical protein
MPLCQPPPAGPVDPVMPVEPFSRISRKIRVDPCDPWIGHDVQSQTREGGPVRKFIGRACVSAALIGWSGWSYAVESSVADGVGVAEQVSVAEEFSAASLTASEVMLDGSLEAASHCDSLDETCCDSGCAGMGSFLDNTVIFSHAENYKSIGDRLTNINGGTGSLTSSFGGVTGFNTGFGVGESALRGQVGASVGVYDLRGRLRLVPESNTTEEQGFFTTGLSRRGDIQNGDPWSFGTVVDAFAADDWGINANSIDLGQVRGIIGYALSERFEIGGWGTAQLWDDQAAVTVAGAPGVRRTVRAANQTNAYLRGNTTRGGSLMGYAGVFDGADIQAWQFGATGDAPLSNWVSLYGNFNYAVPSASAGAAGSGEEQFAMQLGIAYFFGGKAVSPSVTGQRGLPLLDVANNSSFLITD